MKNIIIIIVLFFVLLCSVQGCILYTNYVQRDQREAKIKVVKKKAKVLYDLKHSLNGTQQEKDCGSAGYSQYTATLQNFCRLTVECKLDSFSLSQLQKVEDVADKGIEQCADFLKNI